MSEMDRPDAFGSPGTSRQNPMSSTDAAELARLRSETAALREQLTNAAATHRGPRDVQQLEARIDSLTTRNGKLMDTLKEARQQLLALREEVDRSVGRDLVDVVGGNHGAGRQLGRVGGAEG